MKDKLLLILFCFLCFTSVYAQKVTVSGHVTDDLNEPLAGVSVVAKGTTTGVITDGNGKYSIMVPENVNTLVFTFLGMQRKEISVSKSGGTLDVSMVPDAATLEEVIVTGYGTYKKSAYAGSASTVKLQSMEDVPALDFSTLLQGNAPGVQVSSSSGQPGSSTSITIRGLGSFNASTSPLYVIDGIPVLSGNINSGGTDAGTDIMSTISNSDIENITVIKDAAAASLYGSRAANGVILITTKSGREGKPVFNLKVDFGFSNYATKFREVMGGEERRELLKEGLRNKAIYKDKMTDEAAINEYVDKNIDTYAPIPWNGFTDWNKVLFRSSAPYQNYDFSAAGGDGKISYFTSLNYTEQEGMSYQSHFDRISARVNVKYKMTKQLELGANILYSKIKQDVNSEGTTYTSPLYSSIHKLSGSDPVYNEDGSYNRNFLDNEDRNPKMAADLNYKRQTADRSFNTLFANYKFIDGLIFNTTFSYDHTNTKYKSWNDPRSSDGEADNGSISSSMYQYDQLVWKNNLTYITNIKDKHNLDVLLGYEVNQYKRDYISGTIKNFPTIEKEEISNGSNITGLGGNLAERRMVSYLSRINYNYDNKYFLGGSARIDGSSQLHKDSRWGTFWSASGAWRISEENFMKPIRSVLSETKIYTSFGSNGTLPSDFFGYMNLTGFGYNYNGDPGIRETQIGDKDLKWEKNYNFNVGLDFRLFDRLEFTFEYYTKQTSDLLMNVPTSGTIGFNDYLMNIGKVKNTGVEFVVNAEVLNTKNLSWNSSLNFGHNKNKILDLGGQEEIKSGAYIRRIGHSYYTYYLIQFAGINPETGVPQYYVNDENGDPKEITENAADAKRILYKPAEPKLSGGWTNVLKYKFVDLSFTWTFTLGGYSYDNAAQKLDHGGATPKGGIQTYYRDRWQKPGDVTRIEMFMVDNSYDISGVASTRRVHSSDHLRLKNLTLGITLPKKLTNYAKLGSVRAYFSAVNLLTFAAYDVYDPEVPRNGSVYFDSPKMRTYTFGLDIKF